MNFKEIWKPVEVFGTKVLTEIVGKKHEKIKKWFEELAEELVKKAEAETVKFENKLKEIEKEIKMKEDNIAMVKNLVGSQDMVNQMNHDIQKLKDKKDLLEVVKG